MRVCVFDQSLEAATSQQALPGLFCFYLYEKVPLMISLVPPANVKTKISR